MNEKEIGSIEQQYPTLWQLFQEHPAALASLSDEELRLLNDELLSGNRKAPLDYPELTYPRWILLPSWLIVEGSYSIQVFRLDNLIAVFACHFSHYYPKSFLPPKVVFEKILLVGKESQTIAEDDLYHLGMQERKDLYGALKEYCPKAVFENVLDKDREWCIRTAKLYESGLQPNTKTENDEEVVSTKESSGSQKIEAVKQKSWFKYVLGVLTALFLLYLGVHRRESRQAKREAPTWVHVDHSYTELKAMEEQLVGINKRIFSYHSFENPSLPVATSALHNVLSECSGRKVILDSAKYYNMVLSHYLPSLSESPKTRLLSAYSINMAKFIDAQENQQLCYQRITALLEANPLENDKLLVELGTQLKDLNLVDSILIQSFESVVSTQTKLDGLE